MVMEDSIVTEGERRFLALSAKNLGLDEARIEHLESWHDSTHGTGSEEE